MEKRNKKKLKLCLMTRCANLLPFRNGSKIKCSVSNFILLNLWSTSLLIWRQVDFRSTFNHLFYTETLLFLTNQECNNSSRTTCVHNQPFIRIWLHSVKHFQWILKLLGEGKKKMFSVVLFKSGVSCHKFWSGSIDSSFWSLLLEISIHLDNLG